MLPHASEALSNEVPLEESIGLARRAEELGFDEVWVPESRHGRSATTAAAVLARETGRIGIGVGVVNLFWRHPSLIAMEAAALDEASDGRLRLGIGAALWTLRALGEDDERTRRQARHRPSGRPLWRDRPACRGARCTASARSTTMPRRSEGARSLHR